MGSCIATPRTATRPNTPFWLQRSTPSTLCDPSPFPDAARLLYFHTLLCYLCACMLCSPFFVFSLAWLRTYMMIVFTFSRTHCFLPRRLADNHFLLYFFPLSPPTPLSWCSFLSCSSLTRALCLAQSRFRENDARHLCRVVILCVQHCHDMGIVHRDLRPEHLLLNSRNEDASLKLTGFDYARSLPRDGHGGRRGLLVSESYVTAEYAAPEVLRSTPHGTVSAAVFSLAETVC